MRKSHEGPKVVKLWVVNATHLLQTYKFDQAKKSPTDSLILCEALQKRKASVTY